MHKSSQNLNTNGSKFWHGRAWLWLSRLTFQIEWTFGRRAHFCHLEIDRDCGDGRELTFAVALPRLFSLFFTIAGLPFVRYKDYGDIHRQIGISIHDGYIWIRLWGNPTDSQYDRLIVLRVTRWIFGRSKHKTRVLAKWQNFNVSMPEGDYEARVMFTQVSWEWPRFKRAKIRNHAEIELIEPIWFAGKGENSWDMDDDSFYTMGAEATTIEECQKRVYDAVMRERERHGLPATIYNDENARILNENIIRAMRK